MNETNLKFDRDSYEEIINGSNTFKSIAKYLYNNNEDESRSILIGWTDEGYDHRDILFTYRVIHTGNHQRGMRWCHFFVGIVNHTCYGFTIEIKTDNRKGSGYLKEKLRLHDNHCDDKICELVDGIIHELDILEGNIDTPVENKPIIFCSSTQINDYVWKYIDYIDHKIIYQTKDHTILKEITLEGNIKE